MEASPEEGVSKREDHNTMISAMSSPEYKQVGQYRYPYVLKVAHFNFHPILFSFQALGLRCLKNQVEPSFVPSGK